MSLMRTENPLVLRTDFSDQAVWEKICSEIRKPVGFLHFRANVEFLDDRIFEGISNEQFVERLTEDYNHAFIFLVDPITIRQHDHPLLVIDLFAEPGRSFRALPREIQAIENNLSIGNMDFEEFADAVDESGVFRGFPKF